MKKSFKVQTEELTSAHNGVLHKIIDGFVSKFPKKAEGAQL